jgi:hypothetical protein
MLSAKVTIYLSFVFSPKTLNPAEGMPKNSFSMTFYGSILLILLKIMASIPIQHTLRIPAAIPLRNTLALFQGKKGEI